MEILLTFVIKKKKKIKTNICLPKATNQNICKQVNNYNLQVTNHKL